MAFKKKGRVEKHSETLEYKQCWILIKNVLFLIKICNCVPDVSSFKHVRLCLEDMNTHAGALAHTHTHTEFFAFMTYSDCSVKQSEIKCLIQQQLGKNIHAGVSVRTHRHQRTTPTTSDAFFVSLTSLEHVGWRRSFILGCDEPEWPCILLIRLVLKCKWKKKPNNTETLKTRAANPPCGWAIFFLLLLLMMMISLQIKRLEKG